jgi:hydroxyethylthiazole kinase-like uncharacterized protein yjeF
MHILSRSHASPILEPAQLRQLEPLLQALSTTPLMQSAGLACARLALAVAPHARRIWVAAGPGNNGGDGLEAALHLHQWGKEVVVSLRTPTGPGPAEAQTALCRAQQAGVRIQSGAPTEWLLHMDAQDLCIDALLGIGATRPLSADLQACVQAMHNCLAPVLAIDVPTGLNPQSGQWLGGNGGNSGNTLAVRARPYPESHRGTGGPAHGAWARRQWPNLARKLGLLPQPAKRPASGLAQCALHIGTQTPRQPQRQPR